MKTRLSADERRDEIVAAAIEEFADEGFAGTPTEQIAKRVGVSQPYLFQLFGTKKDLFIAAVRACFQRTGRRFEEIGGEARKSGSGPEETLALMGATYVRLLLADRDLLRLQLHAYAACGDPEIREVVRDEYLRLWNTVGRISGADPIQLNGWFSQGMLINTIAIISDARTVEEFNEFLCGGVAAAT